MGGIPICSTYPPLSYNFLFGQKKVGDVCILSLEKPQFIRLRCLYFACIIRLSLCQFNSSLSEPDFTCDVSVSIIIPRMSL